MNLKESIRENIEKKIRIRLTPGEEKYIKIIKIGLENTTENVGITKH